VRLLKKQLALFLEANEPASFKMFIIKKVKRGLILAPFVFHSIVEKLNAKMNQSDILVILCELDNYDQK
jgi:hypothetical protein